MSRVSHEIYRPPSPSRNSSTVKDGNGSKITMWDNYWITSITSLGNQNFKEHSSLYPHGYASATPKFVPNKFSYPK
jgi:hypothetical protein